MLDTLDDLLHRRRRSGTLPTTSHRRQADVERQGDDQQHHRDFAEAADRCRPESASANSLASKLDIVWAGANGLGTIWLLLPMTIVTAIVSPAARASPSMIAPNSPERA